MKISKILFMILFIVCTIHSQVQQEWVKRYDNSLSSDFASLIKVDNNGDIYVGGETVSIITGFDILIVKYNPSGNMLWQKNFNSYSNYEDRISDMTLDSQGNLIVSGYTHRINGSDFDVIIVKYDPQGDTVWVRRYNETNNYSDRAVKIKIDQVGNVYVAALYQDFSGHSYYKLIKYNSSGSLVWANNYMGIGNSKEWLTGMDYDLQGTIYITGQTETDTAHQNYLTVKLDINGTLIWAKEFNGEENGSDFAVCIKSDLYGNVIVSGNSEEDYQTVKYNSQGIEVWRKRYNGPYNGYDAVKSMDVDRFGNVYVTGSSIGSVSSGSDYTTIKYNSDGVQQWQNRYGLGQFDTPSSIKVDTNGNSYITGAVNGDPPFYSDYGAIKLSNSGNLLWAQQYNGPQNYLDESYDIVLDAINNVYVTGFSMGINTGDDFATIKYSQPIGIEPISNEVPNTFSLSQNYPNPFNPVTKISFGIPANVKGEISNVKLIIYDVLGREVTVLVNEQLKPGTYEVNWDASAYTSGVYFYILIAGDHSTSSGRGFTETRKMILIK